MTAYKGFEKNLICRGYQFYKGRVNITDKANCAQNGFHCAENPLDCLSYYSNWQSSVYYVVKAEGDLDEDGVDSKISCTRITLVKELSMEGLLLHGLAYMVRHPERAWHSCVQKENGRARNGFAVVRGKYPRAAGKMGDIIAFAKEFPDSRKIQEVALFVIDGKTYFPDILYDVKGISMERNAA